MKRKDSLRRPVIPWKSFSPQLGHFPGKGSSVRLGYSPKRRFDAAWVFSGKGSSCGAVISGYLLAVRLTTPTITRMTANPAIKCSGYINNTPFLLTERQYAVSCFAMGKRCFVGLLTYLYHTTGGVKCKTNDFHQNHDKNLAPEAKSAIMTLSSHYILCRR